MRGGWRARLVGGAAVAMLAWPASASATTLPAALSGPCPTSSATGGYGGVAICSGEVASFDGTMLDVDVTKPQPNTGNVHPLIVMLHGFGNNKHEWESTTSEGDNADKWHWNNRWFAEHGYYVLTYTARGFRDDGTTAAYEPPTPPGAPFGSADPADPRARIYVKSRDYEIHDTQWLAALVAATYHDVDPNRVAVTGGSYGGGESWMQASQPRWTFPNSQDSSLPVLQMQVGVPKYPWTDLAYSLAPNGHGGGPSGRDSYESSQAFGSDGSDVPNPSTWNPLGVPKASYILGLFALGSQRGMFDPVGVPAPYNEQGSENIPAWNARILGVGDPYPTPPDPVLAQASRGLTQLRSAYYQRAGWTSQVGNREVAVFSISGWTDDLFEPVESFRMFKYLKRLDPLWPVSVAAADIGHSRAQNKPDTWHRLNDQAWQFLTAQIGGSQRQQTTVSSQPTICSAEPGQQPAAPGDEVTAGTPEGLSKGSLSIAYGGGSHVLANPLSGGPDPNGVATDPIVGGTAEPGEDCRTDRGPALGGYTGYSQPLPRQTTYVGLGNIALHYALTPPAAQAQIDARVWDVPPSGRAYLITRATYRIDALGGYDPPAGQIRIPLYGNHWRLAAGHKIRLDLTQVDSPSLRANNQATSITYSPPRLVLPTRESQTQTLTGTP